MPKQAKESRFAPKLRELGFVPEHELLTPEELAETSRLFKEVTSKPARIPRAKRREYLAKKIIPAFIYLEEKTFVIDELGINWRAEGYIEMGSFDFHNGEKDFAAFKIGFERKLN